eukprot:3409244-Pleurochrysis_carterae.AAC.4
MGHLDELMSTRVVAELKLELARDLARELQAERGVRRAVLFEASSLSLKLTIKSYVLPSASALMWSATCGVSVCGTSVRFLETGSFCQCRSSQ